MLSVAEALKIVLDHATPLPATTVCLDDDALGVVLAENIASDIDSPPFDKAMMDGFALRSADLRDTRAELAIIEEIPAGKTPTKEVGDGQASRIMTGAPIPKGADAVVMIERCELLNGGRVRVNEPNVRTRLNILDRGKEMRVGETILSAGARLRPQELGLLAAVGRTEFKVQPRPRVAILSTGDELVDPDKKPGAGQIRNSNASMLHGQVRRTGGLPSMLGIARDTKEDLRAKIEQGLHHEALILSGGVSAGKLDLVPGVLADLGVRALFHKVKMKPGKPVLFGIKGSKLIFGLPGNPVSSMVCFELFVRPALRSLMALPAGPRVVTATLTKDHPYRTDRPTYHPARLQMSDAGWTVEATPWFGSPDLRGVLPANAFLVLPEGDHRHCAGDRMTVLCVEDEV